MLKSAIKSYCFVSPDFMSRPFCSHVAINVTRWGKFGRVFCKQTSVAACRFQNECNKVVQFWSEIKLVITNRFCNHAFNFRPNSTPLSAITILFIYSRAYMYCLHAYMYCLHAYINNIYTAMCCCNFHLIRSLCSCSCGTG